MPSFDVVSEVDKHELANAIDQANREISNRFDFKGTDAHIEQKDRLLILIAPSEFQVRQMDDILQGKLARRGIDVQCLLAGNMQVAHKEARQEIQIKEGIDKELARKIVKLIKTTKLKVQSSIQGQQLRISGKKRDDLQQLMSFLKKQQLGLPLQFVNLRD